MTLPHDQLKLLRDTLPLADIIRETVELRQVGGFLRGTCPEHPDAAEGLHVDDVLNTYHCFACCRGGDVVRWTMARLGMSEEAAVDYLARKAGLHPGASPAIE